MPTIEIILQVVSGDQNFEENKATDFKTVVNSFATLLSVRVPFCLFLHRGF